jgi:hypothetical protein
MEFKEYFKRLEENKTDSVDLKEFLRMKKAKEQDESQQTNELLKRFAPAKENKKEKAEKKEKPVDQRELAEKVVKDYEKDKKFAENLKRIKQLELARRYSRTRTGRLGSRISQFIGKPSRYPSKFSAQRAAQLQAIQNQAFRLPSQTEQQRNWNWTFTADNQIVDQLEREILSNARGSASFAGDSEAFMVDRIANSVAATNFVLPVAQIDNIIKRNSALISIDPINSINREVAFISRLVD